MRLRARPAATGATYYRTTRSQWRSQWHSASTVLEHALTRFARLHAWARRGAFEPHQSASFYENVMWLLCPHDKSSKSPTAIYTSLDASVWTCSRRY